MSFTPQNLVGLDVGERTGLRVGEFTGRLVGVPGFTDGASVLSVGTLDGFLVGSDVGNLLGLMLGKRVGLKVGATCPSLVG